MPHHLQIGVQIDANNDGNYEVNVTPLDSDISDNSATILEQTINVADLMDAIPGDHVLEFPTKVKLPIKVFGFTLNINYPLMISVRVVDR